jgi:hypothetical protein
VILGNVVSVLGFDTLNDFSFLDAPPNPFHHFFAHHIKAGGGHVTLNLDLCIENAIKDYMPSAEYNIIITPDKIPSIGLTDLKHGWVLHLHGKYGDNLSSLGITIESVTRGIRDEISRFIIEAICSKRLIIFVGYSGSDFFDVNPFFETLGCHNDLSGKHVIWLDYSPNGNSIDFIEYNKSKLKTSILDSLAKSRAKIHTWRGKTIDIIEELRGFWGYPRFPNPSSSSGKNRISVSVEEWKKELVTTRVYVSMGLGKRALALWNKIEPSMRRYESYCVNKFDLTELSPPNRLLYLHNEANRENGLYSDAHETTQRFIRITDLDKMLYLERFASDLWLMGRLFQAKMKFAEGLSFGINRLGSSHRFDILYIECLRGYMQLCRDFGRLPIFGDMLLKRYIKDALKAIGTDNRIELALRMSPYDRSHIARLFAWEKLGLKDNTELPKWLTDLTNIKYVFSETDNLLGIINSMRSEIKATLYSGQKLKENTLLSLLHLSELIEDYPGIVKAYQLLAYNGGYKAKYASGFLDALRKTQWIFTRKLYKIVTFYWHSMRASLTIIRIGTT